MKLIVPIFWKKKNIISLSLFPFSLVYQLILKLISYFSLNKAFITKAKIITVGNVTIGGAGKTPVVLSLLKLLQDYPLKKIAVLTKGYKGKLKGPSIVNELHSVEDIGDEAIILRNNAITCVAKDRLEGVKFLEKQGFDIIITDDGLHDLRFKKNLTIMVVDTNFGFGNQLTFPAGPLRESISSAFKKTDLLVLLGKDKFEYNFPKDLNVIYANYESEMNLKNKKIIAFAGIGNPNKFFNSIKEAEGEIVDQIAFPDHYHYNQKDLEELLKLKQLKQASLITTEKDIVRIDKKYRDQIQAFPISIKWLNIKLLLNVLKKL